eukprot:CAMPEP_0113585172 /NCGR_PEP_ID=MMETSP0015_2-20120614/33533_1 /TAXON_ID=2838 /ORGANISM="Odontella" /LENGTH=74 /DNA_ID=CAMNT_0000490347 /DNA_START=305 /DNA_END=525 /DNA_ORIENTATION=+ /assembly_acc=CAM_ASM_000160
MAANANDRERSVSSAADISPSTYAGSCASISAITMPADLSTTMRGGGGGSVCVSAANGSHHRLPLGDPSFDVSA